MSLPWFRLYHELKDDPKIGALDDQTFRTFIESLCWACEKANGGGTGLTLENANWAFRRNVTETLQQLFRNGLLCEDETGEICVPKWEERQKPSDSSAERVRKFRQKQSETLHVTLQKRSCNGLEESRSEESNIALDIYGAYPRHVAKPAALKAIKKALLKVKPEELLAKTKSYAASVVGKDQQYIPHPATWFNQERFNDEQQAATQTAPTETREEYERRILNDSFH